MLYITTKFHCQGALHSEVAGVESIPPPPPVQPDSEKSGHLKPSFHMVFEGFYGSLGRKVVEGRWVC